MTTHPDPHAPLHLLGVIASPRTESTSAHMVDAVLSQAALLGAETRLLDLRHDPLPLFGGEDAHPAPEVRDLRTAALWADAFVLGTPDYHGGPSGILKNLLDHLWRQLGGKLFAVVVSSNEKGLTVQDQIRTAVRQCYGWSLPYGVGATPEEVGTSSVIADPRIRSRLAMMARDLVVYGRLIRDQRLADIALPPDPADAGFMARIRPPLP